MEKSYELYCVGEDGPPWTSMSQKSMSIVMNAVLRTDSQIINSYISQVEYAPRCSVYYSVRIPSDKIEEFIKLCPYKLSRHPDIQLGNDIIKSPKRVIYDLETKDGQDE